jgi:tetratricopeptide (TPR) repeat protein
MANGVCSYGRQFLLVFMWLEISPKIMWTLIDKKRFGQLKRLVRMNRTQMNHEGEEVTLAQVMHDLTNFIRGFQPQEAILEDVAALQCVSLLAEAHDMMGEFTEAKLLIERYAKDFFRDFSSMTRERAFPDHIKQDQSAMLTYRKLLRQRVWMVLNYIHLLYREEEYGIALNYLNGCQRVVQEVLLDKDDPSATLYGTRARIAYNRALIFHEMGEMREAELASQDALSLTFNRLELKRTQEQEGQITKAQLEREIIFSQHCLGKTEGFCNARRLRTEGKLVVCTQKLRAAIMFFSDVEGTFPLRESLELELGITLRLMAGKDATRLHEAKRKLDDALAELQNNRYFHFRVLIELGFLLLDLAGVQKADDKRADYLCQAEQCATTAADIARGTSRLWRVHILRSRLALARKDEATALKESDYALALTQSSHNKMGEIRTHVEKGKALTELESYEQAIESFETAMNKSKEHSLTQALCHIYLARLYYRLDDFRTALIHLKEWHAYKANAFEHAHIIAVGEQVEKEMAEATEAFLIPQWKDGMSLDFGDYKHKLKKWLTKQAIYALQSTGTTVNERNIAELLGYGSHASVRELVPKRRGRPRKSA